MDAYTGFAYVYDTFMWDIPYEKWCGYVEALLKEYGVSGGLLLELGCGTGTVTELMAKKGYDMIGVDNSPDMLELAMGKRAESGLDILYLLQDMREFELYGTVGAVISLCDSMNYLLEPEEFITVLRLVNNYLDPGGVFIFDLKTGYFFEEIMGDATLAETGEDASYIWENEYDRENDINRYDLTIFQKGEDGRFDRYEETHYQKAYTLEEIKAMITAAGMLFVTAYDALTKNAPGEDSERIYIIAKEQGKRKAYD